MVKWSDYWWSTISKNDVTKMFVRIIVLFFGFQIVEKKSWFFSARQKIVEFFELMCFIKKIQSLFSTGFLAFRMYFVSENSWHITSKYRQKLTHHVEGNNTIYTLTYFATRTNGNLTFISTTVWQASISYPKNKLLNAKKIKQHSINIMAIHNISFHFIYAINGSFVSFCTLPHVAEDHHDCVWLKNVGLWCVFCHSFPTLEGWDFYDVAKKPERR